jgi:hypothetical protein
MMNVRNNTISQSKRMNRFLSYLSTIVLPLCGTILFLSSCDKSLPATDPNGQIAIRLQATAGEYAAGAARSAQTSERQTALIPLEDGLFLRARLETDEDDLRAITQAPLNPGQRLCFAAYATTATPGVDHPVDAADYYAMPDGQIVPKDEPLMVAAGTYIFVIYSYDSTTEYPAHTPTLAAATLIGKDLLWGSATKVISETQREVSITMHRKLSQARVRIKTGDIPSTPPATIEALGNVKITGKAASLRVQDGNLTIAGDATPISINGSDWPATLAVAEVTGSQYYLVAPAATTVTIGSITLKINGLNRAHTDVAIPFTQALTAGMRYTLTVDLQGTPWAGSNIYWDGNQLTFKPAGYVGEANYYQGVSFQWGSLVGCSVYRRPLQGGIDIDVSTMPIYLPTYDAGSPTSSSWEETYANVSPRNWGDRWAMPYEDVWLDWGNASRTRMDLYNMADTEYSAYKGDICRYIGETTTDPALKGYRMPRSIEFGGPDDYEVMEVWSPWAEAGALGWFIGRNESNTANARFNEIPHTTTLRPDGQSALDYNSGAGFAIYQGAIFTATQDPPTGQIGLGGGYWSGSNYYAGRMYSMSFTAARIVMAFSDYPGDQILSVRCIKAYE